jgi:hypothetical protein
VHFFSEDLTEELATASAVQIVEILRDKGQKSYLGNIVVRPVPHAPISAAYVCLGGKNSDRHLLVKASYKAHLLGVELTVEAAPFSQQDTRVGACAQATIWTVGRHYHSRHRGPWISMADITEAALQQTDQDLVGTTPYGSESLSLNAMLRAYRSIGRFPIVRAAQQVRDPNTGRLSFNWGPDGPSSVLARYLDSGIPLALIFAPLNPGEIAHAVTAVGHEIGSKISGPIHPNHPSRASYCSAILVNDDQRGAYRRVPVDSGGKIAGDDYPFTINDHLTAIIIPLPDKVYISGEQSERVAWDRVNKACAEKAKLINAYGSALGQSKNLLHEFVDERLNNNVFART